MSPARFPNYVIVNHLQELYMSCTFFFDKMTNVSNMLTFFFWSQQGGEGSAYLADILIKINIFNLSLQGQRALLITVREKLLGNLGCERSILKMGIWQYFHCEEILLSKSM